MTASEVRDLLVSTLVRTERSDRRHWRIVIGPVRVYDLSTHAHCNWSISPSGDAHENDVVERLLDQVRLDHPIVTRG